jgi:hypothetical protein
VAKLKIFPGILILPLEGFKRDIMTGVSLLTIVMVIVVAGIVLYVINRWVPMQATLKNILNVVVVILVLVWLAHALGFIHWLEKIKF